MQNNAQNVQKKEGGNLKKMNNNYWCSVWINCCGLANRMWWVGTLQPLAYYVGFCTLEVGVRVRSFIYMIEAKKLIYLI